MALPTNVSTGTVTGQFIVAAADGADTDYAPDTYPVQGTVTFTASVPYLPDPTAAEPVTILTEPIVCVLDDAGYLCSPDPDNAKLPGRRGVELIATDDPDVSVTGWTWKVTYAFGPRGKVALPQIPAHDILVPSGGTVDLASAVKVPSSTGVGVDQVMVVRSEALQAAADASASATSSAQSATSAGSFAAASAGSATAAANSATAAAGSVGAANTYTDQQVATRAPLASPTFTGTVAGVTKTHVGLGSVDNTTDMGKPISTATQAALDAQGLLFAPRTTEDTPRRQAWLYGDFMRKLRTGSAVTINAMGDSTTYGYDVVSADKVAAPTGTTPNGDSYTYTRSPVPWPSAMQTNLQEVFGAGNVTVINRGFSGDTATSAYNRWITSSGAGLTLISLGINDANNGATVQTYIESYEKLILREINDYSSAVVILTPFKQPNPSPSRTMDAFRSAVIPLAAKYGVPVIDAEPWLAGYSNDVFSDTTHMNTKGYGILGARIASLFIGEGPAAPFPVTSGTRLSIRPTIDNITYGPGSVISSGGVAGSLPENSNSTAGIFAGLGPSDSPRSVYYSFYAASTDMVIGLDYTLQPATTITAYLDFGVEQPDNVLDELVGEAISWTARASSTFSHAETAASYKNYVGLPTAGRTIRVASPGWHTLKVTGTGGAATSAIRFYAAEFMNYRSFKNSQKGGAVHLPQPGEILNETTDITATRIKLQDVLNRLDIPDWGSGYFKAPPLKVTIRTYSQRVIEYLLVVNSSPTADATTPIEKWVQLRSTALVTTPDETKVREIGSVTFDSTTKEIVFTWLTTSKDLKKNFVMDLRVL